MISYKEAQRLLQAQARSFGREKLPLEEADGRVLAETITADRDYPPFHRSTMDGYAIRYGDFEEGIRHFSVVETIYAGQEGGKPIGRGECYKIMTGAPVPENADTVIRREDTEEGLSEMDIRLDRCRPFQNIARRGEDLSSGTPVLQTATRCEPALMGLLATLGKAELQVERLPRVALLTTGNEIVPVGAPVGAVQIRNSNRWLLRSLLKKWKIEPFLYEHLPDDKAAMRPSLEKALAADLVILTGGVSAGDADYTPAVLEELGVRKLFHKMAIKPGKPAWCGVIGSGLAKGGVAAGDPTGVNSVVFALPGNPFSCLTGFTLLIEPFLHACFGLPAPAPLGLPLREFKKKQTTLDEFFPVRILGTPAGLEQVAINGSGDIRLGLGATALALHPAGEGDLPPGTELSCYSFV